MDCYHIWCDLKPGVGDLDFAEAVGAYMDHLQAQGLIAGHRLSRRKLGFGPSGLGEFHIVVETENLAQLEQAFQAAAARSGDVERLHARVYGAVSGVQFGLYRDFPDAVRATGQGSDRRALGGASRPASGRAGGVRSAARSKRR